MDEFVSRLHTPLLGRILPLLPPDVPIFLVGGAVRDALLNRKSKDLDFVTGGNAMKIARKLADDLGGAYYPLDPVRKVARLIVNLEDNHPDELSLVKVDFSAYQGADLMSDLTSRDFTINAMAVEVHQLQTLVDPTGGLTDLVARRLRPCTPASFLDDPVRILRAVRFSVDLTLKIFPETFQLMREATPQLAMVSPERLRDELFRILTISHPDTSMRILDKLGALEYFLPEVVMLKNVAQSQPHVLDAWNHTLDTMKRLESLLDSLAPGSNPEKSDHLMMGLLVVQLGRYRQKLAEHLSNALNSDRPHRGLLFLGALYHDVAKKMTQTVEEDGRIRFISHDQIGSRIVEKRGQALRLSNLEIDRLATIVSHHMRPSLLSHPDSPPSRKAIYHFFRDTGEAGVDICILSLADMLATYGSTLPLERWSRHVEVVRSLLNSWWEEGEEPLFPLPLINGTDLMTALHLSPGPAVGYLLESIREAQINHEVNDQAEAISLALKLLQDDINKNTG